MGIVLVSTYPDRKSIVQISNIVVKKKLAACVNYTQINSVYSWEGKIENKREFLALFKTTKEARERLQKEISSTHPYQVPEIVELKMDSVNLPYLKWLEDSTLKGESKKRHDSSK